jgi:hypothetical protein
LSVLVHRPATNHALARLFTEVTADSREILRASFSRRPIHQRMVESILRLFSPLL